MEPHTYQILLFFSLIVFASAHDNAISVAPSQSLSPTAAPNQQPIPSEGPEAAQAPLNHISAAPLSNHFADAPLSNHFADAPLSNHFADAPLSNHFAAAPFSNPPSESPESAAQPPSSSIFPIFPSMHEAVPIPTHPDPSLDNICKSTDYPEVCMSTITPLLNGKTDPELVLEMAIKATIESTKLAVAKVTEIASNPLVPPPLASKMGDCKDNFNDALDNFESTMNAFAAKDVGTMNSMLSAAITCFGDCDDEISGKSGTLLNLDGMLTKMTSNCLAIISFIQGTPSI